ncbi:hypothetical protein ONE63_011417 [Megalurothrips usitatus]|uniref:Uncharacterized protein n=1 Tax=Megalurothrips usitatus TaxID=439358 RepID=A0AAV7X3G6_9NEOP|nr:hypothetical protein ONE63_011417 [Megalurothrips usitatus]
MNLFLEPFVNQANILSEHGVNWRHDGEEVNSKFIPTCGIVDAKARCEVLNMAPPTAYHGCTLCTIRGVQANGVKFPVLPHPEIVDPPVRRTDAQIKAQMLQAVDMPAEADAPYYIGAPQKVRLINRRLRAIKHPTLISRNTRGIEEYKKWRGNEWRNFLISWYSLLARPWTSQKICR